MSAFWQALLAVPSGPPVQLVPFYQQTIDDSDHSLITYYQPQSWSAIGHGAFYNSTLTRLPPFGTYPDGTYPGFSFLFATSGQPDEGFDICGALEGGTLNIYANDKLIATAGPGGSTPGGPAIASVRCDPGPHGLRAKPARYVIRVERVLPGDANGNGLTFYLDFLRIFSRALY